MFGFFLINLFSKRPREKREKRRKKEEQKEENGRKTGEKENRQKGAKNVSALRAAMFLRKQLRTNEKQ